MDLDATEGYMWRSAILHKSWSQDYLIVTNSHAQDETTMVTLWHILM